MEKISSGTASHRGKNFVYKGGNGNISKPFAPSDVIYASVDPSVKVIGKYAFSRCFWLKSIAIPEGVEIIEKGAFNECTELNAIGLPSSLKKIEKVAFQRCDMLVSVTFKEGLEIIGEEAFKDCSQLESINLPSTLKAIEKTSFLGCDNLVSVEFKEGLEIIGEEAFNRCSKLETINLPSTLKKIKKSAFKECYDLKSVEFKEGLEIIGDHSFYWCSKLEHIDFPSSLEQIEHGAFRQCNSLVTVKFNEGLEMIGENAFSGCSQLNVIDLPSSLKQIETGTFKFCYDLVTVKFNEGLEMIGENAFRSCSQLDAIDLPANLKTIQKEAFFGCKNLVSVNFKEGLETGGSTLKKVERGTFKNCNSLVSIKFKDGMEIIGEDAFGFCCNLNTIYFPSTLKIVEKDGFQGCNSLVSVKFKEGLEIIGEYAFHLCSKLIVIDLPSTLKKVERGTFKKCNSLVSVKFKEGLEIIGEDAFSLCSNLNTIHLPSTLKLIQEKSFYGCKELKLIEIREGTERLGSRVFAGCINLEAAILPASLIKIGDAFSDCKLLSNIKFPPEMSKAKKEPIQNNTILHQLLDYKYSLPFIKSFLKSCPTAISERNTLGQTPLHLCMTNQSGIEITKSVYRLWPEALHERNEIGKTPLHYWKEMGSDPQFSDLFSIHQSLKKMPPSLAFSLKDGKWILIDNPQLLRCEYMMLEVPESDDETLTLVEDSAETLRNYFHKQLYTRELLFGKLLDEFANLIQFNDKLVIQRAAAVQALCGNEYLSKCLKRHVDFSAFSSSALWYQQEILKLVLRVYHEDQAKDKGSFAVRLYHPSSIDDAKNGQHSLENGSKSVLGHRRNTFKALLQWIVDELGIDDYTFEGPLLKPLQSLFNKIYIRRGQTKVSIVGDMTRATLHIKRKVGVVNIISRIKNKFPDIENFNSPDAIGVEGFMNQVFKMKKVPGTEIIPYRLKANSSQDGKELPLLYNLNFFDMLPEYHRVGSTEMFVAFELQIGLESEIKSNRDDHMAYERRRILKSQSLLKHYIEATGDRNQSAKKSLLPLSAIGANQTKNDQDFKIITAILEGNFSYDKLRALGDVELCGEGKKYHGKPDRLCLNNKRLNRWIKDGQVCILDKVSSLDPSFQYCVKSLLIHWNPFSLYSSSLYVGLFAYVGPYMVNVASRCIAYSKSETNVYIVKPEVNFETLERITPLPVGCSTVLLICWGGKTRASNFEIKEWHQVRDENYKGMKLVLQKYKGM